MVSKQSFLNLDKPVGSLPLGAQQRQQRRFDFLHWCVNICSSTAGQIVVAIAMMAL
jgi:hypothetical protein